MTLAVDFRRAAQQEFNQAALWYEQRQSGLGTQFVAEINRAIELAREHPLRFPVTHREIRCVRVRRFPYSVFYLAEQRRIVVLAVFHGRRDPGVWQQRA
jgi:plasmid stabilization system protein ParE